MTKPKYDSNREGCRKIHPWITDDVFEKLQADVEARSRGAVRDVTLSEVVDEILGTHYLTNPPTVGENGDARKAPKRARSAA